MSDVDLKQHRNSKGKVAIPYLLSTTLSLKKSGRYFYRFFDFHFDCCRNRDCYTERNVRINMTRQWHNIIIPNAILCRESGYIPKFQDAIDSLNHAMTNGKTERSLATWRQICRDEAALPKEQQVVYKYRRSFYFYVRGMAATQKGLLYSLPKSKVITLEAYVKKLCKFIYRSLSGGWYWECPWDGLNELVYKWKHYEDEYNARQEARENRIKELRSKSYVIWDWETDAKERKKPILDEIAKLEKEIEDDDPPEWPSTLRELSTQFNVSMTTAKMFKDWMKQYDKYDNDRFWDSEKSRTISWALPRSAKDKGEKQPEQQDIIDLSKVNKDADIDDTEDSVDTNIDHDIQAAENSGNRPVGSIDDDEISELPF